MKKQGTGKPRAFKSKSRKAGGGILSSQALFSQLEEDPVEKLGVLTASLGEDALAAARAPLPLQETAEDELAAAVAADNNPTAVLPKTEDQEAPREEENGRERLEAAAVAEVVAGAVAAAATQSPARTDTLPRSAKLPPVSNSPSPEDQPEQPPLGAPSHQDANAAPAKPQEQLASLPQTAVGFGSTFTAPVSAPAAPAAVAPLRRPPLPALRPAAPVPRPAAQFKPPRRGGVAKPPLQTVKLEEVQARQAQEAQQAQQQPTLPPPQASQPSATPVPKPEPQPAPEAPQFAGLDPLAGAVTAAALMERETAAKGGMDAVIADIVAVQPAAEAPSPTAAPGPVPAPAAHTLPPVQMDAQEVKDEEDYGAASLGMMLTGSGRSLGGGGLTQMGDSEPQPDPAAAPPPPAPAGAAAEAAVPSETRRMADIMQLRKQASLSRFAPPPVLGGLISPGPAAAFIPSPRGSDPRGPVAQNRTHFSPRAAVMAAAPAAAALAAAAEPLAPPVGVAVLSPGAFTTPQRSLPGVRESLAPGCPGSARVDSAAAKAGSVHGATAASPVITPGDLELGRYLNGTALEAMQNQGGVAALYPWQAACLRAGADEVLRGRSNLVLTAPTSAGKTLIAEVLILRALVWSRQHALRKALVVLPYQALCSQFARRFGPILRAALDLEVRESHGGHYSRALWEENTGVVVCTFESAARVLHETRRRERRLCDDYCCVIVDEVHMLVDEGRGGGLEMLIAKFLYEAATIRAEEVAAAAAAAAAAVREPGSTGRAGAPAQPLDSPVTGATTTFNSTKSRRPDSSAAGNSNDLPTSLQAVTTSTPPGPVGSDCLAGRKVQIVAMSATMPPAAARRVASWLGAALYESDFRPVPLFRFLKKGNELLAPTGQDQGVEAAAGAPLQPLVPVRQLPPPAPWDPHHVGHLVDETVQEGHSVLVFCATKYECVKFAEKLAQKLMIADRCGLPPPPPLERTPGGEGAAEVDEIADFEAEERSRWSREGVARSLEALGAPLGPRLACLVRAGVAYHNSDLPPQHRALVEGAYSSRAISVLCATSTLAAGVNLPARRVILKDGYQGQNRACNVIKPEMYLQMAGRAGRTGEGDRGEAILIHNPGGPATLAHLEALIHAKTPTLADYTAVGGSRLRQLLLDLIVSVGDTYSADIERYMVCLLAAQDSDTERKAALISDIQGALNHLSGADLRAIEWIVPPEGGTGFFCATARGRALAASGLPLEEALAMERELQETNDQGLIGSSDLQACYLCVPPRFMPREPLKLEQWRHFRALLGPLQRPKTPENNVLRLLGIDQMFVSRMTCPGATPNADTLRRHQRFYYALALHSLVQGGSLESVLRDFSLNSVKNVASMPEDAASAALKAKAYCEALGDGWDMLAAALERFGKRISPRAVTAALVEVKGVGPASAKALLAAGIIDPAALAVASEADVVRALRRLGKPGGMEGEPAERVRAEWIARARQMQLEAHRTVKPEALKAAMERQEARKAVEAAAKQEALKREKSQKRGTAAVAAEAAAAPPPPPSAAKRTRREEPPAAPKDAGIALDGETEADAWTIFDDMERERAAKAAGGGGSGSGGGQKRKAGEGSEDAGPAGNKDSGDGDKAGQGDGGDGDGGGDPVKGLPTSGVIKMDKINRVRSLIRRLRRLGSFAAQFDIYDPLQGGDALAAYAAAAAAAATSLAPMPPPRSRIKSHPGSTCAVPAGPGALLDADLDGAEAVAGAAAAAAANPNAPPVTGAVMGLALSWAPGVAAYVPLHPSLGCHRDEVGTGFHEAAAAALGELLADPRVEVVWHGWKRQVGATRWLLACAPGGAGARSGTGLATGMLDVALAAWMTQPDPDMVRLGVAAEPQDLSQKEVQEEVQRRQRAMERQPPLVRRVALLVGMWDGGWDGVTPVLETMAEEEKNADKEREKARKRARASGCSTTAAAPSAGPNFILSRAALAACTTAALIPGAHRRVMALLESYEAGGDPGMLHALRDLEMPIVPMLHDMERQGAGISIPSLEALKKKLEERRTAVELSAVRAAGKDFSLSSTTEVASLLYDTLKIPKIRNNSTAKDVLLEIQKGPYCHDVIPLIIEYRRLVKALGDIAGHLDKARQALARGGPAPAGPRIARVPTKWHQAATATGRFAMGDSFNLICMHKAFEIEQNGVAEAEPLLANMRAAVVPAAPGRVMLSADFGQFELRLLAGFSGDERLQAMVADGGEDPFRSLAASWRRLPPASITAQQRDETKQIIYALIYGMGDLRLAESLNVDIRTAEKLRKEFLQTFPGVDAWMDKIKQDCVSEGFVRTLAGRRRWLPSIRSQTWGARAAAERAAINTVVQGSAADVAKTAMVAVERRLEKQGLHTAASLVLNIHDELLFEVDDGAVSAVAAVVKECMEGAAPGLGVPLRVKVRVGPSWGELGPAMEL